MRRSIHLEKQANGHLTHYYPVKKPRPPSRRWPAIAVVGFLLLWFLWASLPIMVFGFLPLPRGYLYSNLRRNWLRVRFDWQLAAAARSAAAQPRYNRGPHAPLPEIFVVSLRSETARRASVEQQMASLGTDFRWWDAVDGTKALPDDEVRWYVSGSRLKQYKRRAPGSQEWRKIACDLSHLRLMHDMVASGRDIQVVLEDDVQLLGDFKQRLNATLAALPADWDVLWLNHGAPIQRKRSNLRGWVGPGVRMFTDNSATVGMVYRRSFALVMLNDAQIGNKPIDNVMNDVGQLGRVKAYVADPPLVRVHEAGFPSTINVDGSTLSWGNDGGGGDAGPRDTIVAQQKRRSQRRARNFLEEETWYRKESEPPETEFHN